VEVERYGWDALDPKKIRATYQSQPPIPERAMADVCNLIAGPGQLPHEPDKEPST
jgi:hypothetical protein